MELYQFDNIDELNHFSILNSAGVDIENGYLIFERTEQSEYDHTGISTLKNYLGDLEVVLEFADLSLFKDDNYQSRLKLRLVNSDKHVSLDQQIHSSLDHTWLTQYDYQSNTEGISFPKRRTAGKLRLVRKDNKVSAWVLDQNDQWLQVNANKPDAFVLEEAAHVNVDINAYYNPTYRNKISSLSIYHDQDGDGLLNDEEILIGTNPAVADYEKLKVSLSALFSNTNLNVSLHKTTNNKLLIIVKNDTNTEQNFSAKLPELADKIIPAYSRRVYQLDYDVPPLIVENAFEQIIRPLKDGSWSVDLTNKAVDLEKTDINWQVSSVDGDSLTASVNNNNLTLTPQGDECGLNTVNLLSVDAVGNVTTTELPVLLTGDSGPELLTNGNMEQADDDSLHIPGWNDYRWEGDIQVSHTDLAAFEGNRSALIQGYGPAKAAIFQHLTLKAGTYRLTAKVGSVDLKAGLWQLTSLLYIAFDKQDDLSFNLLKDDSDWRQLEAVFNVAEDMNATLYFFNYGPGSFLIDDVSLKTVEACSEPKLENTLSENTLKSLDFNSPVSFEDILLHGYCDDSSQSELCQRLQNVDINSLKPQHANTVKIISDNSVVLSAGQYMDILNESPVDWRGYDWLRIKVHNSSTEPEQFYVEIRDDKTQDYWSRVNWYTYAAPGTSTIHVPLQIFVGEKSVIKERRRLDLEHITRLVLSASDSNTDLTIEQVRLEPEPAYTNDFPKLIKLDAGSLNSPVFHEFTPLYSSTSYRSSRGYGFSADAEIKRVEDRRHPENLLRDWISLNSGGLDFDLPNGEYHVWMMLEDPGYWEYYPNYSKRAVIAEGKTVLNKQLTVNDFWNKYYRHANDEDLPGDDIWQRYISARYVPIEFDITVNDGQLNIRFEGNDNPYAIALSALVIYPTAEANKGTAFLAELWQQLKQQFNYEYKQILAATPQHEKPEGQLLIFHRSPSLDIDANYYPSQDELVNELSIQLAQGEYEPLTVSLYPNEDLQLTNVELNLPGLEVTANQVRYKLSRQTMDGSVSWNAPRLLDPLQTPLNLPKNIARRLWFTVHAPENTSATSISGNLKLSFANGQTHELPITVKVLPYKLPAADVPIGYLGLAPSYPGSSFSEVAAKQEAEMIKSIQLLHNYGMTGISGGIGGPKFQAYENGQVTMDFTQANKVMSALQGYYSGEINTYAGMSLQGFSDYSNTEILSKILAAIKANGLSLLHVVGDEPGGEAIQNSLNMARAFKQADANSRTAIFTSLTDPQNDERAAFAEVIDRIYLTHHNQAGIQHILQQGSECATYNLRNRYHRGVYQYKLSKLGCKGHMQFMWSSVHVDPWYDLDGRESEQSDVFTHSDGTLRHALELERYREAVDDYRYLLKLEQTIANATDSEVKTAAQTWLQGILDAIEIGHDKPHAWTEDGLDEIRNTAVSHINNIENPRQNGILFSDKFDYPEGTQIDVEHADIWNGRYDDRVDATVENGRAVLGGWASLSVKQKFMNLRDQWTRISVDLYDQSHVVYSMNTGGGAYGISVSFDGKSRVTARAGNLGYLPHSGTHMFAVKPDSDNHIRIEIYLKDKISRIHVIDTQSRQSSPDFSNHYGDIEFSLGLGYHGAYDNVEVAYLTAEPPTDATVRAPVLVTEKLAEGFVNRQYMLNPEDWMQDQGIFELQQIRADGGTTPLHYEIIKDSLPQGLTMRVEETNTSEDGSGKRYLAVLDGTPEQAGYYPFTIQVKDAEGRIDEKDYMLRVVSDQPPIISLRDSFDGEDGTTISEYWLSDKDNIIENNRAVLKKGIKLAENPRNDPRQYLHIGMKLYAPKYPVAWNPYSGFSLVCASATTFGILAKFNGSDTVVTSSNNFGYEPQRYDQNFTVQPLTDGAVQVDMYLKGKESRIYITDANGLQSTPLHNNYRLIGICENQDYIMHLGGGGVYDEVVVETVDTLPEHYNDLTIRTKALLQGHQGVPYKDRLQAVEGKTPYRWQISGLPLGLNFTEDGIISGTVTQPGDYPLQITVIDGLNKQATLNTTLKIHADTQANLLFADYFEMPNNGQLLSERDGERWSAHPNYALSYRDGSLQVAAHKQGGVKLGFMNDGITPLRFSWKMNKSKVNVLRKDTCWGIGMEYDSIQHVKVTWGDHCYQPYLKQQDFLLKTNSEEIEVAIEVKGQFVAIEIRDSKDIYQRGPFEITSRDITGYEMGIAFRDNTPYGVGQYTSYQSGHTYIDNLEVRQGIWSIGNQPSKLRLQEKLGKLLFFDPILSRDNNRPCSSCHDPKKGFADGEIGSAKLDGDGIIKRNTPGLTNIPLLGAFFHDGRAPTVVEQSLETIQNPEEMDQNLDVLVTELNQISEYQQKFTAIWNDGITAENIGKALEAYTHTLLEMRTKFDWELYRQGEGLTEDEDAGLVLFKGKAQCTTCHFTEPVNQIGEIVYSTPRFEVTGTPSINDPNQLSPDSGHMKVTGNVIDKGAFRVPPLRDLVRTAPYMHNGVFNTIEEVVEFYNDGGGKGRGLDVPNQSEFVKPLNLTDEEQRQLVAFLKAMSPEIPNHHTVPESVPSGLPVGGTFGTKINNPLDVLKTVAPIPATPLHTTRPISDKNVQYDRIEPNVQSTDSYDYKLCDVSQFWSADRVSVGGRASGNNEDVCKVQAQPDDGALKLVTKWPINNIHYPLTPNPAWAQFRFSVPEKHIASAVEYELAWYKLFGSEPTNCHPDEIEAGKCQLDVSDDWQTNVSAGLYLLWAQPGDSTYQITGPHDPIEKIGYSGKNTFKAVVPDAYRNADEVIVTLVAYNQYTKACEKDNPSRCTTHENENLEIHAVSLKTEKEFNPPKQPAQAHPRLLGDNAAWQAYWKPFADLACSSSDKDGDWGAVFNIKNIWEKNTLGYASCKQEKPASLENVADAAFYLNPSSELKWNRDRALRILFLLRNQPNLDDLQTAFINYELNRFDSVTWNWGYKCFDLGTEPEMKFWSIFVDVFWNDLSAADKAKIDAKLSDLIDCYLQQVETKDWSIFNGNNWTPILNKAAMYWAITYYHEDARASKVVKEVLNTLWLHRDFYLEDGAYKEGIVEYTNVSYSSLREINNLVMQAFGQPLESVAWERIAKTSNWYLNFMAPDGQMVDFGDSWAKRGWSTLDPLHMLLWQEMIGQEPIGNVNLDPCIVHEYFSNKWFFKGTDDPWSMQPSLARNWQALADQCQPEDQTGTNISLFEQAQTGALRTFLPGATELAKQDNLRFAQADQTFLAVSAVPNDFPHRELDFGGLIWSAYGNRLLYDFGYGEISKAAQKRPYLIKDGDLQLFDNLALGANTLVVEDATQSGYNQGNYNNDTINSSQIYAERGKIEQTTFGDYKALHLDALNVYGANNQELGWLRYFDRWLIALADGNYLVIDAFAVKDDRGTANVQEYWHTAAETDNSESCNYSNGSVALSLENAQSLLLKPRCSSLERNAESPVVARIAAASLQAGEFSIDSEIITYRNRNGSESLRKRARYKSINPVNEDVRVFILQAAPNQLKNLNLKKCTENTSCFDLTIDGKTQRLNFNRVNNRYVLQSITDVANTPTYGAGDSLLYDGKNDSVPVLFEDDGNGGNKCLHYIQTTDETLQLRPDKWHDSAYRLYCGGGKRRDFSAYDVLEFYFRCPDGYAESPTFNVHTWDRSSNTVNILNYIDGGVIDNNWRLVQIPINDLATADWSLGNVETLAWFKDDQNRSCYVDNIAVRDTTAPSLVISGDTAPTPESNTVLRLTFSEAYDQTTIRALTNYQLISSDDTTINPQDVGMHYRIQRFDDSGVPINRYDLFLQFDKPFQNGESYSLIINGIKDRSGNTIAATQYSFTYNDQQQFNHNIKVNQVGYLPNLPKVAYVGGYLGDLGGGVWAVGDQGKIMFWNQDTGWQKQATSITTTLRAVAATREDDAWAVGDGGVILHWNGKQWSQFTSPTNEDLLAITFDPLNNGWAVGANGTILHYQSGNWRVLTSPTNQTLHSVWAEATNAAWAVGNGGTIIRWNGTSWTMDEQVTDVNLYAVGGSKYGDLWAVGANATILQRRYNHWKLWTDKPSGTADLKTLSWNYSGGIWIAGDNATLWHKPGYGDNAFTALNSDTNSNLIVYTGSNWQKTDSLSSDIHAMFALPYGALRLPATLPTVSIRDVNTHQEILNVPLSLRHANWHLSGEDVYQFDFSALQTPGEYYAYVPGLGISDQFKIANDVLNHTAYTTARGLFYQRSGMALTEPYAEADFTRPLSHKSDAIYDASLNSSPLYNNETIGDFKDVHGGWHDAGDYGKYMPTAATALWYLLTAYDIKPEHFRDNAWNIPESKNTVPDLLDEARWELDWIVRTQDTDGGVYHKVTAECWHGDMPHTETDPRHIYAKTTHDTALAAALFASAARIWQIYDADLAKTYLDRARLAWNFLQTHSETTPAGGFKNPQGNCTGEYNDADDADNRLWAAAELYRTTGEDKFRIYFDNWWANNSHTWGWHDWQHHYKRAYWAYLRTNDAKANQTTQQEIRNKLILDADNSHTATITNPYQNGARLDVPDWLGWGEFTQSSTYAFPLLQAWALTGNNKYREAAGLNLDAQLGANPLAFSFITGIGKRYPQQPLHKVSHYDNVDQPVPGTPVFGIFAHMSNGKEPQRKAQDNANNYPPMYNTNDPYPILRRYTDAFELVEMSEFTIQEMAIAAAVFGLMAEPLGDVNNNPDPNNIAPTISGNPPTIAKLGYNYTFTPTASDDNDDSLTFSITNKPDWATFDTNTGRLSGTPNATGNYTGIEISVSDGKLSAQLTAFNIEVVQSDTTAPTFETGYPKIENITQTTADLKVKINENGKAYYVVLADGATAPTDVKTHANKVTIDLTANTEASSTITGLSAETAYDIYLIIEDTAGNITQAATYPIDLLTQAAPTPPTPPPSEPNIAPTISGNPATVIKVGYSYTFTPTASDDNGDSLTFSITNKPDWATFDTNTGTLSGTPNATGNYTGIEISVSDGQISAQLPSFNIEVKTANRSPTISGTPRTQIDVGQNYEFIPTASDPDGDSLTFSIKNKPDWAIFDSATGKLSGQPSSSQTGTSSDIEISVTDGNATVSLSPFSITVNAAAALFKPSQLIVTAAVGGVNPASQKLRVNYPNGYDKNKLWSYVTVNASFAKITSALTSSKWIEWNVSFKTKKLAIGQHNGSITVKTDNGDQTVPIVVTILDTAELQLSRSQLNFGGVQGGKAPKKQKIKVSSSGSKILNWSTATNANWLTIEPSQGTTTSKVKVGINASQLANVGEHTATISFINNETAKTIDVPITLDVVAANTESVKLTALEVVQVIQDLNNSIPLIAEKPTFVRAHVSSTIGKPVNNVNAKLTGKNGDTVIFEISPSNAGGSINVSDNPNRSKINDSFLFELPKEHSTGNLTLEFAGVDKPFACENCTTTVSFETIPAIDMKLVDIVWLRKQIEPTQKMRQAIPENIYNIYPISTLNITQSNTPFILNSPNSLKLLRTTISNLFLRKYLDGPAAENQYYYGVGGKFYGTVGISLIPGTLAAGAYIKGIDLRNFANNLSCVQKVNSISSVTTGPNAIYGFNAKTKRIYPPTTSDFMTKRTGSWISDYNYKCAIETLKATNSTRSSRSLRSSLINIGDNTVTINGRITGTNSGVIDNLVNAVATTSADAPTVGDYKMSLQTSDGTELAAYSFGPININVGGDDDASSASSESAYSLILPRPDNMKRIVLLDKNLTKLDERIASANAPTVTVTTPNGGETIKNDAEKLTITWNANDVDGDTLTYAIDYSLDAGNNWKSLVSGYDQKSIEIDVALLAGTSQAKFRVTADDSFNSGSDESDAVFTVEGKDPEVSITSPNNGDLFISGQTINFVGQAYDKEDGKITGTWSSDRDGDFTTLSKLAEDLAEGTHTITLTATDSQNQTGTSTISINVYRERPTSLPATFSVSEDNFTIGGYVNGGTATADLTISNGGDGSLTWSAASDANWLTLSQTSGTAPSDIKLIANPAELDIGVYSGNVILTSDIPGVIAKTIEVTFRLQEAPPIVSVPVQQNDNSGTNKVDNNIIDGATISKDETITGATLRGNIINEGTLKDINFEGEELKGGTLAGKIANKGVIIDVKLSENTEILGGSLRGNIVGASHASLDNLKIVDNSQVSNVSLGKNVIFGTDVTLKDVKFMGASISNCKLEGTIRTGSSATTIKDVVLGAKAKVIGGKLAGTIKGDSSDRALLQHLTIEPNSQLTEVIIADGVDIPAEVNLGIGVQFTTPDNIPFNIDLTQTLPSFTNSIAVDLSADPVVDGKGLLVSINDLPSFIANNIDQSSNNGHLKLKVEDLTFEVIPVKVKRVDSKDQNVRLGFGNTVYFKNENGIEVEAHPAVQDLTTLQALLAAIKLPKFNISKKGNIQVPINDKLWFSGRAELASKPSKEEIIGFKFKGDLVVLVFEKDGQKREQVLYPAPASALNEEASLTEQGILSFRTYKGKLDYSVENGEVIESLTVSEIADSNGDGLKDFLITYPQGDKQKLFALPASN
jgi:cytochrome c peroxidase